MVTVVVVGGSVVVVASAVVLEVGATVVDGADETTVELLVVDDGVEPTVVDEPAEVTEVDEGTTSSSVEAETAMTTTTMAAAAYPAGFFQDLGSAPCWVTRSGYDAGRAGPRRSHRLPQMSTNTTTRP